MPAVTILVVSVVGVGIVGVLLAVGRIARRHAEDREFQARGAPFLDRVNGPGRDREPFVGRASHGPDVGVSVSVDDRPRLRIMRRVRERGSDRQPSRSPPARSGVGRCVRWSGHDDGGGLVCAQVRGLPGRVGTPDPAPATQDAPSRHQPLRREQSPPNTRPDGRLARGGLAFSGRGDRGRRVPSPGPSEAHHSPLTFNRTARTDRSLAGAPNFSEIFSLIPLFAVRVGVGRFPSGQHRLSPGQHGHV